MLKLYLNVVFMMGGVFVGRVNVERRKFVRVRRVVECMLEGGSDLKKFNGCVG